MENSISISGSNYTVSGNVRNIATNEVVAGLNVVVYHNVLIGKDHFLGIGVTDVAGKFQIKFNYSAFGFNILDKKPDLYFIVDDGGTVLLNTKDHLIQNADVATPPINLLVDLSTDKLRGLINPVPVPGWVGGFAQSNPDFSYPNPNLSSLAMLDNLANINKLERQQKVVWPEFSWETDPGAVDPKRCYQMFAPDISRLGYTNEGRVYSIICPQQGAASPVLGSMNVEVTVTGNRGWANETDKSLAADMTVEGKIWFSPRANQNPILKTIAKNFSSKGLPFPFNKANAIRIATFKPGNSSQAIFPLSKGESTDFPIPDFARHDALSWTVGHLGVEIGNIVPTEFAIVNDFNQLILDGFNAASGNMLKAGNVLTWNVWFTAPEYVDQVEWAEHAEKWRQSIDADHGSPDGNGTSARYFNGEPFNPLDALFEDEMPRLLAFMASNEIA
jgi:hypothetical protein